MANEENLIPLNKRCKEDAKKIRQKGAKAANKKQKQNKTFRELTQQMLNMKADDDMINIVKTMFPEYNEKEITARVAMLAKQYENAIIKGDSKAFEVIRDTAGEKPIDKSEHNGQLNIKGITFEVKE